MKPDNLTLSIFLAFVIGIVQMFVLLYFWVGMTLYVQHVPWLLAHGVHGAWLKACLFVFDNTVNLALCMPAAIALCTLRPRKLWLYLILAIVPGFLWNSRLLLTDTSWLSHWTIFVPGVLMELLTLPVAVLVARSFAARRAT